MRPGKRSAAVLIAALALGGLVAGGCKKKEVPGSAPGASAPPDPATKIQVTQVHLGTALGPDKRVTTPATSFTPKDSTIFASVVTEGIGAPAELTAKWTYQDGQVVGEAKRPIAPSALAVTEFSMQKPDGWPTGDYKLEIMLDGKSVDTKTFKIQ